MTEQSFMDGAMSKPPFKPHRPFKGLARRDSHSPRPSPATGGRPDSGLPKPSVGPALMLYGVHAVGAAWLNPERQCRHLYGTPPALTALTPVIEKAKALGLKRPAPVTAERNAIERMLPQGAVHQGLALDSEPLPAAISTSSSPTSGSGPIALVLLDQV